MHSEGLLQPHRPGWVWERLLTSGDKSEGLLPMLPAAAARPATPALAAAVAAVANCVTPCTEDSRQATAAAAGEQRSLQELQHEHNPFVSQRLPNERFC